MDWFDRIAERASRHVARNSSRRGMLRTVGTVLLGAGAIPLLPVARGQAAGTAAGSVPESGDPASCDYWRYCAIDGFLCSCCGGTHNQCPPGTEMAPITWIGTCRNPVDGIDYVISYNDCCGKGSCALCNCDRSEGDRSIFRPDKSNDINWCLGASTSTYNCSTAIVIGIATPRQ